ncbi:hypothetical protein EFW17_20870 [Halostreptopolyspora alba]|uniref:Uncharacterized protein n=2 Tax=Halostreptopolyspora alba TaxID=2487137 RepID=A0A3N0E236_9ACTN|nr:hypothetical protein EFW17_20870 [Nocardiopsaceae bacterium YIM 96095]
MAEFATIVAENLNVAGTRRDRHLDQPVPEVDMGGTWRQLDCRNPRHGHAPVVANRWFVSSKTCSECGVVKAKPRLNERVLTRHAYGHTVARDLAGIAASTRSCAGEARVADWGIHAPTVCREPPPLSPTRRSSRPWGTPPAGDPPRVPLRPEDIVGLGSSPGDPPGLGAGSGHGHGAGSAPPAVTPWAPPRRVWPCHAVRRGRAPN